MASLAVLCAAQASLSLPDAFAGYELLPGTTSPTGKFGLIYPSRDALPNIPKPKLLLVALPTGDPIINIPLGNSRLIEGNSDYYVTWNKASSAVLVVQGGKWGADKVYLARLGSERPGITDITGAIRQILQPCDLKSGARPFNSTLGFIFDKGTRVTWNKDNLVASDSGWRFGPGHTVLIDCTCTTDPKEMDPNRWAVNFTGTWDMRANTFTSTHVKKLP